MNSVRLIKEEVNLFSWTMLSVFPKSILGLLFEDLSITLIREYTLNCSYLTVFYQTAGSIFLTLASRF